MNLTQRPLVKRSMRTLALLLVPLVLSCNHPSSPPQSVKTARVEAPSVQLVKGRCTITKTKQGYEQANVGREVLAAIKRGELRYVALSGYGAYVPGIEEWIYKEPQENEVCWIGNVDLCTQTGTPIGVVAVAYAAAYNRELKQQLNTHSHAGQQVAQPDQSSGSR